LSNYASIPQEILDEDIAKQILYSAAYVRGVFVASRTDAENMIRALSLARVEPVIDQVFDFEHLRDAYKHMSDGKHFGKVVIRV
jgi:D-arabinose 1-dehydrogenase-like Zn-dependent alcohol dehydrogenase